MMGPYLENLRSFLGPQPIILPGVRAIILNEREDILLQHRTDMPLWGLPSGSVELSESALEALKREVLEETGLLIRRAEPMAHYSGPSQRFKYPNGDEIQCSSLAFIVREWSGTPKADGVEGSEVRFWAMQDLPDNLVPLHAKTLDDLKEYDGNFMISDTF